MMTAALMLLAYAAGALSFASLVIEIWPVRPVHTTMRPMVRTEDSYWGNRWLWRRPSDDPEAEEDRFATLEHFWGFTLGPNGGYIGFNYWHPAERRVPRIRFAAMYWYKD